MNDIKIKDIIKRLNEHKDEPCSETYSEGFADALSMMGFEPIFDYEAGEYVDLVERGF